MPDRSNGKQFIGPRILTRQQFLRGLDGSAAAFGLGSLQACESRVKEARKDRDGGDDGRGQDGRKPTKRELFGRKGLSYLDREVTDPTVVDYLTERAASFGQNCQEGDVPSDMEISLRTEEVGPVDAGGISTNDLRLISPIDLERSPVLMDYLSGKVGRGVTPENASCSFATTRFFAAATSKALGFFHPVIGITDSVFATVHADSGRRDQATADILVMDCAGVTDHKRTTVNNASRPRGKNIDQNQAIPGRDSLINAYFDYLVGYRRTDGQKVYVPFDPSRGQKFNPSQGSIEYGGLRVVEYQKVFPDVGGITSTPPSDASSPDSLNDVNYDYETAEKQGQLVDAMFETDIALAGGETYAVDLQLYMLYYADTKSIEYRFAIPQGAEQRKGDPVSWTYLGAWKCQGLSRDGCTACCDSRLTSAQGGVTLLCTSIATACAFTGIAVFACLLASAIVCHGLWNGATLSHSACTDPGCEKTFYRVPGSPPG